MGLTESTYCGSNRKIQSNKETIVTKVMVRRYEDEELLSSLANGFKRGGRGRRKNRRANRMLRRARAELMNLKLGTNSKVLNMKREIEELNEYIQEMKRNGERIETPKMKELQQKNKQLSKMISKSREDILFDDKKICELEQYIKENETRRQSQVMKAFAMPSPAANSFGEMFHMQDGLRGKYEVLGGNDLWGLFFYKVLVVEELHRMREEFRKEKQVLAESKISKEVETIMQPQTPIPSMEPLNDLDPKAKLTHVWWKPVNNVNLKKSVWAKIGYKNSKIDTDALLNEFDRKKKDSPELKIRKTSINNKKKKKKKKKDNNEEAMNMLSMKRSIEMGIAFSKLKWSFEDVQTRLGMNDALEILTPDHHLHTNGLTMEKIAFLLKLLPTKEEALALKSKKPTSGMLMLSLLLYDEIPDIQNRLLAIKYWYKFRDTAMNLERSAYHVLKAVEVLEESNAFKKTLQMLRTIGNFLNAGQNSIGIQHGFTMSSLCKFAETRGNSKLSVLDFAILQLNKFEKLGLDLPEETECLHVVLGRGPHFLEKLLRELEDMVVHTEKTIKRAKTLLLQKQQDKISFAFVKKFTPWIRTAREQLSRVSKLLETVLREKVDSVVTELVPDNTGSFNDLMNEITRFSSLFVESRHRMLPDYVPRPRILWTPSKIGRSSPRMLLKKRVESISFGNNTPPLTSCSNSSSPSKKSGSDRRLICLPPGVLPGISKWVLRSKGLSPKKEERRRQDEGSKSEDPQKKKRTSLDLSVIVQRQIKSDTKRWEISRSSDDSKKSRRELFPLNRNIQK